MVGVLRERSVPAERRSVVRKVLGASKVERRGPQVDDERGRQGWRAPDRSEGREADVVERDAQGPYGEAEGDGPRERCLDLRRDAATVCVGRPRDVAFSDDTRSTLTSTRPSVTIARPGR